MGPAGGLSCANEQFRVDAGTLDVGRLEMLLGTGRVAYSGK